MNDETTRAILKRLQKLERQVVRYRQGVVTDDSPLSVSLGGSDVDYTSVAAVAAAGGLAVDDVIAALTFGNDMLVLGAIGNADRAALTGEFMMYGGASTPAGWLACDGASYLRTAQQALFDVIGTAYGSADGTHFNVPDLRSRIPVGTGTGSGGGASGTGTPSGGAALTVVARGTWRGEETHTLSTTEIPSHNHGGSTGTGSSSTTQDVLFNASGGGALAYAGGALTLQHGNATVAIPALSISSQGGGGAHNTQQPVLGIPFFIKA